MSLSKCPLGLLLSLRLVTITKNYLALPVNTIEVRLGHMKQRDVLAPVPWRLAVNTGSFVPRC